MRTILLILLFVVQAATFGQTLLTNTLYICYPLDGNATDYSGNANHGTVSGAMPVMDRFGNAGKAMSFDGVNDFISIGNTFPDMAHFSISLWVYHTKANYPSGILSDADPTAYKDLFFNISNSGVGITADKNGGNINRMDLYPLINYGPAVTGQSLNNAWHHMVWVCDSGTQQVYIDTVLKFTSTLSGTNKGYHNVNTSIGRLGDGVSNGGYFQYYQGYMDDFRMYSAALSFAEIKQLFQSPVACQDGIGITELPQGHSIALLPNPAEQSITIAWPANAKSCTYKITDALGCIIISGRISSDMTIDVCEWACGFYSVQFSDGFGAQKFIKN
jgi:hypothetical protein